MSEGKGVVNHLHEVAPLKLGKPVITQGRPLQPFKLRPFLEGMHANVATSGSDYVWSFMHRKKGALIMEIADAETPAIIVINDVPVAFYPGYTGRPFYHLILDKEPFRRGKNVVRVAPIGADAEESDLLAGIKFYETKSIVTADAEWSFAKWEQPKAISFKSKTKSELKGFAGQPAWFRTFFSVSAAPTERSIWFEPTGLSKGQLYVNGHNLGRYFMASPTGQAVGPQKRLFVPVSWLKFGDKKQNEIVVFDEHGCSPEKSKIVLQTSAI